MIESSCFCGGGCRRYFQQLFQHEVDFLLHILDTVNNIFNKPLGHTPRVTIVVAPIEPRTWGRR